MHSQGIGDITEIGRDRHFDALRREREADRIDGIVWNSEAGYVKIADCEAAACLKDFDGRHALAPIDKLRSTTCQIHRELPFGSFHERGETAGVIAMFMRDQNGVQTSHIFADGRQTLGDFAAAQAGIDQNPCTIGGDEGRVSGAGGGENADLEDFGCSALPYRL
jgi:hypothetical protein